MKAEDKQKEDNDHNANRKRVKREKISDNDRNASPKTRQIPINQKYINLYDTHYSMEFQI